MPSRLYSLESGEPKVFKHDIDALEHVKSGTYTYEDPKGAEPAPKKEEKKAPKTIDETDDAYQKPDIEVTEPAARRAPRRRSTED